MGSGPRSGPPALAGSNSMPAPCPRPSPILKQKPILWRFAVGLEPKQKPILWVEQKPALLEQKLVVETALFVPGQRPILWVEQKPRLKPRLGLGLALDDEPFLLDPTIQTTDDTGRNCRESGRATL